MHSRKRPSPATRRADEFPSGMTYIVGHRRTAWPTMNKPNSPWSIKGVTPEARDAAKDGARISRQPLGRWLGEVIRKTSAAETDSITADAGSAVAPGTPAATASPSAAATWQEAVVRLEAAISETGRQAAAAVIPLEESLERIADRLDSIETYVLRRPRRSYLTRLLGR